MSKTVATLDNAHLKDALLCKAKAEEVAGIRVLFLCAYSGLTAGKENIVYQCKLLTRRAKTSL
jgi:hypothetical protein